MVKHKSCHIISYASKVTTVHKPTNEEGQLYVLFFYQFL